MKRFIALILVLIPSLAFATAGSITGKSTLYSQGGLQTAVCHLTWTASSVNGSVPDTTLTTAGCDGVEGLIISARVGVSAVHPTALYNAMIFQAAEGATGVGVTNSDSFGGAMNGMSATGGELVSPWQTIGTNVFPANRTIDTGKAKLHIDGNIVNSASGYIDITIGASKQ